MRPRFDDIVTALLYFAVMAFAVYLLGWSMNLWWMLGWDV